MEIREFMADEEAVKEIKEEIRANVKLAIMTMEIYWDELQKSVLPEELKKVIIDGVKNVGGMK